jgi:hypothetical protein
MILKYKDSTLIHIGCDCGCSGIEIKKHEWNRGTEFPITKEYYIYHYLTSFDAEQSTTFTKFKKKLKMIWNILTTGHHRYNEILLTEEQFLEVKEAINSM